MAQRFLDLLKCMLVLDPSRRIDAQGMLKHACWDGAEAAAMGEEGDLPKLPSPEANRSPSTLLSAKATPKAAGGAGAGGSSRAGAAGVTSLFSRAKSIYDAEDAARQVEGGGREGGGVRGSQLERWGGRADAASPRQLVPSRLDKLKAEEEAQARGGGVEGGGELGRVGSSAGRLRASAGNPLQRLQQNYMAQKQRLEKLRMHGSLALPESRAHPATHGYDSLHQRPGTKCVRRKGDKTRADDEDGQREGEGGSARGHGACTGRGEPDSFCRIRSF